MIDILSVQRIFLSGVASVAMVTVAAAECVAPKYQIGNVASDTQSEAAVAISIRLNDFAPTKLVCLAEALKRRYHDRTLIGIAIFSSAVAAKYYRGWTPERATPNPRTEGRFHSRDLHGMYTYNAATNEEYVDVKPVASDVDLPFDTRIMLPATTVPHCRYEINGRCLLNIGSPLYLYPPEAYLSRRFGSVTVTGIVTQDGKVTDIKVIDATTTSKDAREMFVRGAVDNVKTWRVEEATHRDAFRTTYTWEIDPSLSRLDVQLAWPNQITIRVNPPVH